MKLAGEFLPNVSEDLNYSFDRINGQTVDNMTSSRGLFFGGSTLDFPLRYKTELHTAAMTIPKMPDIAEAISWHVAGAATIVDRINFVADCVHAGQGNGSDEECYYKATLFELQEDDEGEVEEVDKDVDRIIRLPCTCSFELSCARQALADCALLLAEKLKDYRKALGDYEGMDEAIEALEMQTVAKRVEDSGGADLIEAVMGSVNDILDGKQLDTPLLRSANED